MTRCRLALRRSLLLDTFTPAALDVVQPPRASKAQERRSSRGGGESGSSGGESHVVHLDGVAASDVSGVAGTRARPDHAPIVNFRVSQEVAHEVSGRPEAKFKCDLRGAGRTMLLDGSECLRTGVRSHTHVATQSRTRIARWPCG